MASAPAAFQHFSDFEDVSIPPSPLDHSATTDGSCQTQPSSFTDSECLIIRGAASAKTCPTPFVPSPPPPPSLTQCPCSYSPSHSWQPSASSQSSSSAAATSTGTHDDCDPAEDKRVQADVVDIAGSSGPPAYDAAALAAFLRTATPMMEQEIKRGSKSTALRSALAAAPL